MKSESLLYQPLYSKELSEILGLTIKRDEVNKVIAFLSFLSAYTENSQLNLSFNAPSSTGKSFIPLEIARLFPTEDVIPLAYTSPTAFFHGVGQFDAEREGYIVNLSRRIIIFLDQPHTLLLQHLRPLLSHDKKEIEIRITDKSQKAGLRTKNIFLIGFPAVIFCTANYKIDEQEATRFLLLSPETSQEKIREAIFQKIQREADSDFDSFIEGDSERRRLRERIEKIKYEGITEIKIGNSQKVTEDFFKSNCILKPRHMRDIDKILSLVKCFALLNVWHRQRAGSVITANDEDIEEAFKLWSEISESQELNLPPYIFNFYRDIILPAFDAKGDWLSRSDIIKKHFEVYGRTLPDWQLRQDILPMLEMSGLISQEKGKDPADKRKVLIYPTTPLTIVSGQNNSEPHGGVTENNSESDGGVTDYHQVELV